jgi:hypothetical protein
MPDSHCGDMQDDRRRDLADKAAKHHGVFTRRDAIECGVPDSTLLDGVATGRYRRLAPGVYAVAGSPETFLAEMATAVLAVPVLSALSHRTAADLWGLTDRGFRRVDVVTTRWDRVRRPGVQYHESLDLIEDDVVELRGLPVTSAERTVVDLGAVSPWDVERALEAGIRLRRFTIDSVDAFVARVAKRGRRGVGVVRPFLEERRKWDTATESVLEDAFRAIIDRAGLPLPVSQFVIRDESRAFVCRADFAYPSQRVLIELDSEAHHMDRITFRRDRWKQNHATLMGWTVLRYTWWDVNENPYKVVCDLETALERRHDR